MHDVGRDSSLDTQKGLPNPEGVVNDGEAQGNEGERPGTVAGDSPTEGTVDGPLAPTPSPGSPELDSDLELTPSAAGETAAFNDMSWDNERQFRRASPYNLR